MLIFCCPKCKREFDFDELKDTRVGKHEFAVEVEYFDFETDGPDSFSCRHSTTMTCPNCGEKEVF